MRKQKTPQEMQEQADYIIKMIEERQKPINEEYIRLTKLKDKVRASMIRLDDPHAVIPKEYRSVSEWISHSSYPDAIIELHIFPNRLTAQLRMPRNGKYHVVRCRTKEFYLESELPEWKRSTDAWQHR